MGDLQPTSAEPVLDYVRAPVAGRILPEAEALIDQGAAVGDLQHFFQNAEEVVDYYAQGMARRHDLLHLNGVCVHCGAADCRGVIQVHWEATIRRPFLSLHADNRPSKAFATYHPICPACLIEWIHRCGTGQWTRSVLTTACVVATLYLATQMAQFRLRPPLPSKLLLFLASVAAVVILVLVLKRDHRRWLRRLPRFLVEQMPEGVTFESLGDVLDRDAAGILGAEIAQRAQAAESPVGACPADEYPNPHEDPTRT